MKKADVDIRKVREAVGKFLFHVGRINDHLSWKYTAGGTSMDLNPEEGHAKDWAQKLVKEVLGSGEDSSGISDYLEMYEDSLLEFQATRVCKDFLARGETPLGSKVFEDLYRSKKHVDFSNLNGQSLTEFAKSFEIERDDAADLKVFLLIGSPEKVITDENKSFAEALRRAFKKSGSEN
jgi:hypothetical protein